MTRSLVAAPTVTVTENSHQIGRYDIYELTMSHSGSYANPWEDVVITAVFTVPSNKTYSVGGFYYDTDTWKLRFAPMEQGNWTWDLKFDNGSGTFTDSGGFTCVAEGPEVLATSATTSGNNRGFLRIHPRNPFRFITDGDNKVFYPMGFNDVIYDQVLSNGLGKGSDGTLDSDWCMDTDYVGQTIDHYFDTFAAAGNNIFRMNTQLNTYVLWSNLNVNGTGKNTYKVAEGKLTDQLAQKLHDGGWRFYMVFWQKPNLGWDLSDPNVKQATLSYHKYVIDRWGAYVDIWELMNERKSKDDRYFDVVTSFIRGCDPYDHIISTSNARPDLACIDINSPHRYDRNDTLQIHRRVASQINNMKAAHAKPILYGEFGNRYPPYTNYDPERYRIFIWTAMFNEAALVFWHTGYTKSYKSGAGNMYIGTEERAFSSIFRHFTADFDDLARPILVTLDPSDEIYASALGSSRDIGIYFTHTTSHTAMLSGATVTLDIPEDGMQGSWLCPITGKVLKTFTVDSSSQTLMIPNFQVDIALRIRSEGKMHSFPGSATLTGKPAGVPTITLLSPTGGECYTGGQTVNVTWTSTNFTGNVRIDFYKDYYKDYEEQRTGQCWDWICQSTTNDGHWAYALPDVNTTHWKVRVAAADDREPSDESGFFSIKKAGSNLRPVASLTTFPTNGPAPLSVGFDGSASIDPEGDTLSYSWDFGDSKNGIGVSLTHSYSSVGTYTATLTVDDGNGRTDTDTVQIAVTAATD